MYTVKVGGDIHKGDLIAVANGNDFTIGIYYGRGQGGTVQYIHPSHPASTKEWYENRAKNLKGIQEVKPFRLLDISKSYISSPSKYRIIKLNRDNITDQETIEQILEAKEILQEFNITVNY
jgi:hypothetical protein